MHEPGDILLFTLSAWKETGWSAFKKAFDEIYKIRLKTEKISDPDPVNFERARALRTLITLGHCDVDFTTSRSVIIGPPALASLPYPGLPRAVLCGSRSPTTVKTLQRICKESRQSLRLILENQRKRGPYAPLRVEVEAESYAALEQAARTLNIPFNRTPQSWVFTAASGSIAEYTGQLEWSSQPEVNWEKEDFDSRHFAFQPAQADAARTMEGIRLCRYLNPTRLQWEYRLVKDDCSASVNPQWGRYAVLNATHQNSLLYDKKLGSLAVAYGAPLPAFIARALVLCSGYVAATVTARVVQSSIPEHYGFDVYAGVPPDVVNAVACKLGQRDPVDALSLQEGE
jgi:hypothetical protein